MDHLQNLEGFHIDEWPAGPPPAVEEASTGRLSPIQQDEIAIKVHKRLWEIVGNTILSRRSFLAFSLLSIAGAIDIALLAQTPPLRKDPAPIDLSRELAVYPVGDSTAFGIGGLALWKLENGRRVPLTIRELSAMPYADQKKIVKACVNASIQENRAFGWAMPLADHINTVAQAQGGRQVANFSMSPTLAIPSATSSQVLTNVETAIRTDDSLRNEQTLFCLSVGSNDIFDFFGIIKNSGTHAPDTIISTMVSSLLQYAVTLSRTHHSLRGGWKDSQIIMTNIPDLAKVPAVANALNDDATLETLVNIYVAEMNMIIKFICWLNGVTMVDISEQRITKGDVADDGLHPTQKVYDTVADLAARLVYVRWRHHILTA